MFKFFKSKENQKQVILVIVAIVFMILGTLNLEKTNESSEYTSDMLEVASRNVLEETLGDVQLVSSNAVIVENDSLTDLKEENTKNYFEETRLERDRMYSESIEIYQKILESKEISEDQKLIATNEITKITNTKNAITIAENLMKDKIVEDVVILENNGTVNVIVESHFLNQEEISKIQNIIQRELKVEIGNISISRR